MINEENFKILSVPNAGIVLISSLFPPLFEKLGLLDRSGNSFKDFDSKIHAIFVIQYLVNKKYRNISADDLKLNGLLVDYTDSSYLSTDYKLSDSEIEIMDQLLLDVKILWDKIHNTSIIAMQYSFFLRNGELQESQNEWVLTVEKSTFDVLIELPLEYHKINFPWMKKPIRVIWN